MDLLKGALEIYSPSGDEQEMGEYFARAMQERGFDEAYVDEAGNAVGRRGTGDTVILFLGHMDTVPGFIEVREEHGELWGRGACDAKGGIAAMIEATAQLSAEELEGKTVMIAACVEEEIATSKGARHIMETLDEPDFVINGEPSGFDAITLGYKGCQRFVYTLEQEPTHHANPKPNANEQAFRLLHAMGGFLDAQEYKKDTPFYTPYLEIRSWEDTKTGLEERVQVHGNVRIPPGFPAEEFLEHIQTHITELEIPGALEWTERIEGIELPRSSELARTFAKAMRSHDIRPRYKVKTGSSDMNVVLTKWKNAQMLAYSPGDSKLDHTPEERISLEEYDKAIQVLHTVIGAL